MKETSIKQQTGEHMYTRREALKIMSFSMAGLAFAGPALTGCGSKQAKAGNLPAEFKYTPAPEGSRISSREWPALGAGIGLLGLGCMRLPTKKVEGSWSAPLDQEVINEMVDYSLAHGVNYFDTAPAYGESEKAMGIALSRYPRDSYYLATKMSNFARGRQAPTLESAKQMFATSLANLQTDRIDFFLMHALGSYPEFEQRFVENGVLDYLISLKQEGKIKFIGFSFHGDADNLRKILDYSYKWDFVQIQMNYLDWKGANAEGLYNMLAERNIPVAIMEPIRGGALANVNDGLRELMASEHPELSPAGMALTFAASFPGVMVTLSGMSNMEQLRENVATFTDFKPFTEKDNEFMMTVARLYNENVHIPCTGCAYCMPCPNGVNIPGNFAVFNTTSDALAIPDPKGEHDAEFKKKAKGFIKKYMKELEDGMRADACTKCDTCLSKCPQHIRIPDQLQMINDLVKEIQA